MQLLRDASHVYLSVFYLSFRGGAPIRVPEYLTRGIFLVVQCRGVILCSSTCRAVFVVPTATTWSFRRLVCIPFPYGHSLMTVPIEFFCSSTQQALTCNTRLPLAMAAMSVASFLPRRMRWDDCIIRQCTSRRRRCWTCSMRWTQVGSFTCLWSPSEHQVSTPTVSPIANKLYFFLLLRSYVYHVVVLTFWMLSLSFTVVSNAIHSHSDLLLETLIHHLKKKSQSGINKYISKQYKMHQGGGRSVNYLFFSWYFFYWLCFF